MDTNNFINTSTLIAAAMPFEVLIAALEKTIASYKAEPSDHNKAMIFSSCMLITLKQTTEGRTSAEILADNARILGDYEKRNT